MKSIFTLLLATVFTSSAFAYDGGKLTISVASNKNVQVYVDGRVYQDQDNNYVLNNVQPGNHTIQIYSNARNVNNNNNGYGNVKNRNNRNDRRNLVYTSTVYVRQSYHVDVMINRFGKALVDERVISGNGYDDESDNSYNNGYGNSGYDNGEGNNGNNSYQQAMSDNQFNQMLQKIRNQWIGKLSTAKDAVNSNYLNTYQVRQVVQLFSSESDKLELAKLSYKNIVDRQNFRQLYDLFSYQSQTELDRYVRDYRN